MPPFTYCAFLSHSHADKRPARRWQRRLESLVIERGYIGRETPLGPVPERLKPIFRGRDDLPAGGELNAETLKALAESAALILLASPSAAKSKAVNEEVRLFRHLYPARPVVVILHGPKGTNFRDHLPPAMRFGLDANGQVTDREHTPLAADPRAGADGVAGAMTKVVVGLTGLTGQDVQPWVDNRLRWERRVVMGAIAAVVVLALAGGGAGWKIVEFGRVQATKSERGKQREISPLAAAAWAEKQRLEDKATAAARHAELVQLAKDAKFDGPAAAKAFARFRDLLRPFNPGIDQFPDDNLPEAMQRTLTKLTEPGANPNNFAGAAKKALQEAQTRVANQDPSGAAKVLDDELTRGNATARDRAAMLAERGRVEKVALKYREAAKFYTQASGAVAFDDPAAWQYTMDAANALYARGDEYGDNPALYDAIAAYHSALRLVPRDRDQPRWASTQNNLGAALATIGVRESGIARLEQAAEAYRFALLERTRDRVPLDWAATLYNLGNALRNIGERESGTVRLRQAAEAYRFALLEYTRDRAPLNWAMTQSNLGTALQSIGERESGKAWLEEAAEAYRFALLELTRDRVPLDWAATQSNLGTVLQRLGARESGTMRLEEAVEAYRSALLEYTRDRVPLDWAVTQNNLGTTLRNLGERESGTVRLRQAAEAFRLALLESTRDGVPLNWAFSQHGLANTLSILAARLRDRALMDDAIVRMRAAAEVYREGNNTNWLPEAEARIAALEIRRAAMPPP